MRYKHSTTIECPMCEKDITVTGKVHKTNDSHWEQGDYEVEEVDITECPSCGAEVADTAIDAISDTDEGPTDDYDGPDTLEEVEPLDWEPFEYDYPELDSIPDED